jgi:hypothetical protein
MNILYAVELLERIKNNTFDFAMVTESTLANVEASL